jgi:uncharacterized membrane-anchored protein YjiN (DUF445 family)
VVTTGNGGPTPAPRTPEGREEPPSSAAPSVFPVPVAPPVPPAVPVPADHTAVAVPPPRPAAAAPPAPGSVIPPPLRDEERRRTELAAMKRVATGLLGVAFVVFVTARLLEGVWPWMAVVRATAEASLVGGLADWFAVTALFRRPLGLPIPHTAIIPTQKDRIGRILGNFLQNHFLSTQVLAANLKQMHLADRSARWLADRANAQRLAGQLAAGVAQTVQALPETQVRELIRESAVSRLQATPLAPLLSSVLAVVAADERHQALLDEALQLVADAIDANRTTLREVVRDQSPWWLPGAVDSAIYERFVAAARRFVDEVQASPHHPVRLKFDVAFHRFIDQLKSAPEVMAKAEAIKREILESPAVEDFASSLWDKARGAAAKYADKPREEALEPVGRGIAAAGESLLANPQRLDELDDFIIHFIASLLEQNRQEVADLIAFTVQRWDADLAAQRIELAVGRDLQFIRLNGTIVGGLAGLAIYLASLLFR